MNSWQAARQIQYLLQQETWDGSTPVFASANVVVTVASEDDFYTPTRSPLAIVTPLNRRDDEQEPNLKTETFGVRLVVINRHDEVGEAALIGSNRTGQSDSRGRGLLEIEEKLFDAVALADRTSGFRVVCRAAGAGRAEIRDDLYLCARDYELEAVVTADRSYAPVRKLSSSVASGTVTLSWTLPGDRFDRRQVVVRRASGSTAPASATAGTGVTLGSDLPSTVDDTPGSGTWSYAVFVGYDEYGSSTNERFSSSATAEGVVVP